MTPEKTALDRQKERRSSGWSVPADRPLGRSAPGTASRPERKLPVRSPSPPTAAGPWAATQPVLVRRVLRPDRHLPVVRASQPTAHLAPLHSTVCRPVRGGRKVTTGCKSFDVFLESEPVRFFLVVVARRKSAETEATDRGMATRETMERVPFLLQQERLNNETRQLPKTIDNGVISIALGNCLDHCQWLGPILFVYHQAQNSNNQEH